MKVQFVSASSRIILRVFGILTMFILMATAGKPAHANLIQNGGFETPFIVGGTLYTLNALDARLRPWVIVDGSVDVVDKDYWPSDEGNQSLDLSGLSRGKIVQNFATTQWLFREYRLEFVYANNPDAPATSPKAQARVSVFQDESSLFLTLPLFHETSTRGNMQWTTFGQTFTANGPSTALMFQSLESRFYGIVIDKVSIEEVIPVPEPIPAPVPEPMTFLLLGAGLVTLATVWRRQNHHRRC